MDGFSFFVIDVPLVGARVSFFVNLYCDVIRRKMEIPQIIADLALILITAGITTIIFKWLKQPVILGYILAGFLVSRQFGFTPSVSSSEAISTWADIGVVFLMFGLGLEFSFKKLMGVGRTALIAAMVIIPGMVFLGTLAGLLMGWTMVNSLLLGGMISMSSTTIIMKAFTDMGLRTQKFAQLVLGILIFEDLIAILLLVIISTTAVSKSFQGGAFAFALVKLAFFLVIWLLGGIFFLPSVLKYLKRREVLNDETLLIISLGFCLMMVIFATKVGFSSELGAFVMGSVFAETVEAERIDRLVKPLKDLFGAVFFVSVGMLIEVSVLCDYVWQIVFISMVVIGGQVLFASCGLLLSGQSLKTSIQSGFCLTQVGEFAFIIALLGTNLGLLDKFVYPVIVAVSVVTIFITPFLMKLSLPVYNLLERKLPRTWLLFLERNNVDVGVSVRNDNVWFRLLKAVMRIVLVYSTVVVAVLIVYVRYLEPVAARYGFWSKTALALLTILVLSPFLRAIVAKKNHSREYKYLWASKKTNWTPLISLSLVRFLLAIFFLVFLLVKTYNGATGVLFAVATILIMLMYFSRMLKMHSIRMERRFFHNLNQREYEEEQHQSGVFRKNKISNRLLTYDLHLADFEVSADSPCCGKTLIDMDFRRKYSVHVVSIMRGSRRINIPGGKEQLFPADKILVLGSDEQLTKVEPLFDEADDTIGENDVNEVRLEQLEIEPGSHLIGKTIRESGIRDNNKCLVVGIEREAGSMVSPDVQTAFQEGDVIWIVGEKDRIAQLMKVDAISIVDSN